MRITDKLRYGSALPLSNAHVVTNGSRLCFRLGMRLISQKGSFNRSAGTNKINGRV